jgi:hypothetical protein
MDSSTSKQHNTRMQQTQGQQRQQENNNGNNNGNNVTLDLRVSCNTFWKYEMKLAINRDDYVEPNENSINCGGGGAGAGGSCFNSDDKKTRTFSRLERFMCDAMIAHIHEDLALTGQEELIEKLCDISSKFHIHGHTTRSLLYHQSNAPHADHGGLIYICTHC